MQHLAQQTTGFLRANKTALRFLLIFGVVFGVCYFLLGVAPGVRLGIVRPYTVVLARFVTVIINLFGAGAVAQDTVVRSPEFMIDIGMGCDGIEASSLFLAGVVAYPTSWRAKLSGLVVGVPLIQVINLARLVGLYYAGLHLPSVVEEVHVYVAQTIVILLSTAILVFWLSRVATEHDRPPAG
jgi:exosortase H (IPTLxxWG-CTERM-specific)